MLKLTDPTGAGIFYATPLSAGFDIRAAETCILEPGQYRPVATGLRLMDTPPSTIPSPLTEIEFDGKKCRAVPELQIRPRSGLAAKSGVTVLNAPGTIDADYRGEIKVILINHSQQPFVINQGDRIAQGVCQLCVQLPDVSVQTATRGEGGFGSTGHS